MDTISSSGYDCISKPDATSVLVVSVNNIDPGFLDDFLQAYLEKLLVSVKHSCTYLHVHLYMFLMKLVIDWLRLLTNPQSIYASSVY